MDQGTHLITVERTIALCTDSCFDAWLAEVWLGGGGLGPQPTIVKKGDDVVTMLGSIRMVPGYIQEEILESERGAAIVYRVKSGPFPVSYHRGRIEFVKLGENKTRLVWSVSYTPYLCMGPLVRCVISVSFRIMLRHLARVGSKL